MLKKSLLFCALYLVSPLFLSSDIDAQEVDDVIYTAQNAEQYEVVDAKPFTDDAEQAVLSEEELSQFEQSLSAEEKIKVQTFFELIQNRLVQCVNEQEGQAFTDILVARNMVAEYIVNVFLKWKNVQTAGISDIAPDTIPLV